MPTAAATRKIAAVKAPLVAIFVLTAACGGAGAGTPLFAQGDIEVDAHGAYHVRTGLVQIEAFPGVVVSASQGTRFFLREDVLDILAGELRVLDRDSGTLAELGAGSYRLEAARILRTDTLAPHAFGQENRQPVHLTDGVMLFQANALRIDTRQFVQGLLSFFRRGPR